MAVPSIPAAAAPSLSSSTFFTSSWRLACLALSLLLLVGSTGSTSTPAPEDETSGSSSPLSFAAHPPPSPRLLLRRQQRQLQQPPQQGDAQTVELPPSVPVSVAVGGNAASSSPPSSPSSSLKNTSSSSTTTTSGLPTDLSTPIPTTPIIEAERGNSSILNSSSSNSESTDPANLPVFLGLDNGRPAQVLYPSHIPYTHTLPLVLILHAWGSNGTYHAAYLGVTERVDKFKFIALLPDGMKNSKGFRFWNAPACCNRENIAVDDLGYLTDLLDEAKRRLPVDPEKVYVMGHSNGGQMALYLACRSKEVGHIQGFVSIAGFGLPPGCRVPRPCSALLVHGTGDDIVPYDLSTEVFNRWVEGENCLPTLPPSIPPSSSTSSAAASLTGASTTAPPSIPYCKRWKAADPFSILFPGPSSSSSSSSFASSTCTQSKRDFDCDSGKARGVKDPSFSNYRDDNCGLDGDETTITQYLDCGGGREGGREGGANVTFWRMEGATHVPALSPKAQDEMMTFLLGPPPAKKEVGGRREEGPEAEQQQQQQQQQQNGRGRKKKRTEKLRV